MTLVFLAMSLVRPHAERSLLEALWVNDH